MTRWTIRNVEIEVIQIIQELANSSGTTLGEALSVVIRLGAGAAQRELEANACPDDVCELLQRILLLQDAFGKGVSDLQDRWHPVRG